MNLEDFLEHKTLYYDKIELNAMQLAWQKLSSIVNLGFVVHIVGTNGKGTTGRFLAHYLSKIGKKTLHYSSPHISKFNERIWINGEDISDENLEKSHQKLQTILDSELLDRLTYFEYTTLLAILLSDNFDFLIFEAGLGGEFDATSVVPRVLSLITTIDFDHQAFLGNTIDEIAATKLRSCQNDLIIGHQVHQEIYNKANELFEPQKILHFDKNLEIPNFLNLPNYLQNNLRLSCAALHYCGFEINFELFLDTKITGRFHKISPNITIDVGHNPLAAREIAKTLGEQKINIIYGSYKDKDYKKVLEILKPNILQLEVIEIDDPRIENFEKIIEVANELKILAKKFDKISSSSQYLVFGSFKVVEHFLAYFSEQKGSENI